MFFEAPQGWFKAKNFGQYQRVSKKVYVYILPIMGGWDAKLYLRGNISCCECEVRTDNPSYEGFMKMISIYDEWLSKYNENIDEIKDDKYCIYNPHGVWMKDIHKKEMWV